ncbi:hypothetical protein RJ640_020130 [Escallonia rubra]|uniref:Uncharacterized protein n=1 Tax=Escallonia rubra TaxID=112253 RepID=A0AA88QMR6_9ASTE|nr:hypothetical protein RJ640_020130 [Escallonia rubra]
MADFGGIDRRRRWRRSRGTEIMGYGLFVLTGTAPGERINVVVGFVAIARRDLTNLTGYIPSTLTKLTHLRYISVSRKSLSGPIPPVFSKLKNLVLINLSFNRLSSPIISVLSQLTQPSQMYLDHNRLTGRIPNSFDTFTVLDLDCEEPPSSQRRRPNPLPQLVAAPSLIGIIPATANHREATTKLLASSPLPENRHDVQHGRCRTDTATSTSYLGSSSRGHGSFSVHSSRGQNEDK